LAGRRVENRLEKLGHVPNIYSASVESRLIRASLGSVYVSSIIETRNRFCGPQFMQLCWKNRKISLYPSWHYRCSCDYSRLLQFCLYPSRMVVQFCRLACRFACRLV